MMEIVDARQSRLKKSEVRDVAEIEAYPDVMKWEDDPIGDPDDLEHSVRRFKDFFHNLNKDDRLCLLARLDDRIVGFLAIGNKTQPEGSLGSVSIMVSPLHQNKGIGTKLLKESVELSRKSFNKLEIETLESNAAMRRIAEKTGFQLTSITPCRWREGKQQTNYHLLL